MGNLLPFGDFDIIAHLMVGLAMFFLLDIVFGLGLLYRTEWNVGSVTGIVLLAYLFGHLISIPSKWLFEDVLVGSCLGRPATHLVPASDRVFGPSCGICAAILWFNPANFNNKAPQDVLVRIAAKLRRVSPQVATQPRDDTAFFDEAFVAAKRDPNSYERMMIFQRLYILFRNMGLLALCGLFAVLIKRALICFDVLQPDRYLLYFGVKPWMLRFRVQFAVFLVLSIGLCERYLDFYRLFALEVLRAYAYAYPLAPLVD